MTTRTDSQFTVKMGSKLAHDRALTLSAGLTLALGRLCGRLAPFFEHTLKLISYITFTIGIISPIDT